MAIFEGLVEDIMEVFMDDFSISRDSFDLCLQNLERVLNHRAKTRSVKRARVHRLCGPGIKNVTRLKCGPIWADLYGLNPCGPTRGPSPFLFLFSFL